MNEFSVFNVYDYSAAGDGITDDMPHIQSAINAAADCGNVSGSIVYFPCGTFLIQQVSASKIIIPPNVILMGSKSGSTIYIPTLTTPLGLDEGIFEAQEGAKGVRISRLKFLHNPDMNVLLFPGCSNAQVDDCEFIPTTAGQPTSVGTAQVAFKFGPDIDDLFPEMINLRVSGNFFQPISHAVLAQGEIGKKLTGVQIVSNRIDGIDSLQTLAKGAIHFDEGTSGYQINDNIILGADNIVDAIVGAGTDLDATISSNTIEKCKRSGIGFLEHPTEDAAKRNLVIAGNSISDLEGIVDPNFPDLPLMAAGVAIIFANYELEDVIISNNTISDSKVVGIFQYGHNTMNAIISGNNVSHCETAGIYCSAKELKINSNSFTDLNHLGILYTIIVDNTEIESVQINHNSMFRVGVEPVDPQLFTGGIVVTSTPPDVPNSMINQLMINGNSIEDCGALGIVVNEVPIVNLTISNNSIFDVQFAAILYDKCQYGLICHNRISSEIASWGIMCDAGSEESYIFGNYLSNFLGTPVQFQRILNNGQNTTIRNNVGYRSESQYAVLLGVSVTTGQVGVYNRVSIALDDWEVLPSAEDCQVTLGHQSDTPSGWSGDSLMVEKIDVATRRAHVMCYLSNLMGAPVDLYAQINLRIMKL